MRLVLAFALFVAIATGGKKKVSHVRSAKASVDAKAAQLPESSDLHVPTAMVIPNEQPAPLDDRVSLLLSKATGSVLPDLPKGKSATKADRKKTVRDFAAYVAYLLEQRDASDVELMAMQQDGGLISLDKAMVLSEVQARYGTRGIVRVVYKEVVKVPLMIDNRVSLNVTRGTGSALVEIPSSLKYIKAVRTTSVGDFHNHLAGLINLTDPTTMQLQFLMENGTMAVFDSSRLLSYVEARCAINGVVYVAYSETVAPWSLWGAIFGSSGPAASAPAAPVVAPAPASSSSWFSWR